MIVSVNATNTILLHITRTNTQNPIQNIRLVPIEYEATYQTQIFHPQFLLRLAPFQNGVIRFCYWQRESYNGYNTAERLFANRATATNQTQNSNEGVALDYMIVLANYLNASPWFCMPQVASAAYSQQFASIVAQYLNANLRVYVEYSNRVGILPAQAAQSLIVFNQFTTVFGPSQRNRLVLVAGGQYLAQTLQFFGPQISQVDAVAFDGSFGTEFNFDSPNWDMSYTSLTVDAVINLAKRAVLNAEQQHNANLNIAQYYNLTVIAFEGGPYMHGPEYGYRNNLASLTQKAPGNVTDNLRNLAQLEQNLENVLIQAHRDPRMKDILMDFVRRWRLIGAKTFVTVPLERQVALCQTGGAYLCGSYALSESWNQSITAAPKYAAMVALSQGQTSALPLTSADLPPPPTPQTCQSCVWGTCDNGTCICYLGYSGSYCSVATTKPNSCMKNVGMNVAAVSDYSTQWPFVDVFKASRQWVTEDFTDFSYSTSTPFVQRPDGYPTFLANNQAVSSLMLRDLSEHYPAGTYVCLYDGDGTLNFLMDDVLAIRRSVGRIEVDVKPTSGGNNGVMLRIDRTNPNDPIRNVRFIMPGFEQKYQLYPFHPLFLHYLERYSTLRFMEWQNTNAQTDVNWVDRTTPSNRTFTINGVALETMIKLVNTLGTDAWFNMPHLATDDYITQFATMVKQQVRPDIKIYIEYSNEVWGTEFSGGVYSQQQGLRMGLSTDANQARFCYYGLRSSQIFAIWKNVWGSDRNRLVFTLSSQAVNPDVSQRILDCNNTYVNADALAIAPYFSSWLTANNTGLDTHVVALEGIMTTYAPAGVADALSTLPVHYQLAAARNLKLITYESGQSILNSNSPPQSVIAMAANRDSRMQQIYITYLNGLIANNVSLINHFSSIGLYSKYGSYGLMESLDQDTRTAPKYLALQSFMQTSNNCSLSQYSCKNGCSGNGECLSDGQCYCYAGFTGDACQNTTFVDYIDCSYKCTFDNGVCVVDHISLGYQRYWTCQCNTGWYGAYCAIPSCPGNCSWAGTCTSPGTCQCFDGFKGQNCEIDCKCNGRGICDATSSTPKCKCDPGFKLSADGTSCVYDCTCPNSQQTCIGPNECSCITPCKYGTCLSGMCTCWQGYTGVDCSVVTSSPNDKSPIGMNIGAVEDYNTEWIFVDVMKEARAWIPQNVPNFFLSAQNLWDTETPLNLRSDGYPVSLQPGQAVGTLMQRDLQLHYPGGIYTCLYDGDGSIVFSFDATIISQRKGVIKLMVTPSAVLDNGIYMQIIGTNPANPIRNIRVLMPGFEFTADRMPFHPQFLDSLRRYGTFRFMDWALTNSATDVNWNDRTTPTYISQAQKGVSLEYMIMLANWLKVSPWFCIPHTASDQYVTQYATMVQSQLRTDVNVFVEHSNEVWNGMFSQNKYATTKAQQMGINVYQYHSLRTQQIGTIFINAFASNRQRLVIVAGSQLVNPWITQQIMTYANATGVVDAVGVAAYIDCGGLGSSSKAATTALSNVDNIIQACYNALPTLQQQISAQVNVTQTYNKAVVTYEAGMGLVEDMAIITGQETPGLTALFVAANRDARMRDLYNQHLNMFRNNRLNSYTINHFSSCGLPSKDGSWGLLEYTGQDPKTAPKYLAAQDFITLVAGTYNKTGCTDVLATNYDATATVNDKSCVYPPQPIPPSGGAIHLSNVVLNFPTAALTTTTNISVGEVKYPPSPGVSFVGSAYRFGPSGLQFSVPVPICVDLSSINNQQFNSSLKMFYSSDDATWQMADNSTVDLTTKKVCGNLMHFTLVAVMDADTTPTSSLTTAAPTNDNSITIAPAGINKQTTDIVVGVVLGVAAVIILIVLVVLIVVVIIIVKRKKKKQLALTVTQHEREFEMNAFEREQRT
jgi:hypothetical protein